MEKDHLTLAGIDAHTGGPTLPSPAGPLSPGNPGSPCDPGWPWQKENKVYLTFFLLRQYKFCCNV